MITPLKRSIIPIALFLLVACVGCGRERVYLMDGRVFTVEEVLDDGIRVEYTVMGRHYNMPKRFRVGKEFQQAIEILHIRISDRSISCPGQAIQDFDQLYMFIDENIGIHRPAIIEICEPESWTQKRRDAFSRAHGSPWRRPDVGLEGAWIGNFEESAEDY